MFYKIVFLKISQNSQGNTCARVSFLIKLPVSDTGETLAPVFSFEFYEISKKTFFYRTPPMAASEFSEKIFFKKPFDFVVTKTGNDHKRPQTTSKRPQTTTNHQQTTTNYQQTTTNDHPCTLNQKSDVSFLFPTPVNNKEHTNFEKHTLQWQISGGRGPNRIVGLGPTKVSSINERGVLIKRGPDKNILI